MADTENNKNSNSPAERAQCNAPALRFPGFTEPWQKCRLGDYIRIFSGESPNCINSEYGKIPYYKVEQLNWCEKYLGETPYLSQRGKNILPEGCVVFSKRGAAILTNKVRMNLFPINIDTNLMGIKADNSFILDQYLFYFILRARLNRIADTSTIPQINNIHINPIIIYVPSLAEQEIITKFLALLDERIATQRRLIEKLETLIKGIVVSHFNSCNTKRTIVIKDLGEAYSVGNLSKDDLSEYGERCIIYGELFTTYGCVAHDIQSKTNKYTQATLSRAGDLLFPASTTVDAISLIAPTSLQTDGIYVAGDMFGIHILPQFNSGYISYLLNYVYNRVLSKYAQGSTIIHLHYTDIKNKTIQVPCLEEQKKCAELLEALQTKLDIAKQLIDCFQIQKSYLLQQMFI